MGAGVAILSMVLFGLWMWIDDQAVNDEGPKADRDAADAEFERTMKDIEDGK
ncbi:hypothetical protein [Gluconacetobacter sacchari]|uniref:hypothetical protein n=1 Tax=Gluconacetobacter sacchari TaxID=92759 RepID=UPI00222E0C64|nr:hypothetical protein [Gluconacetobacter sacchari]